MVDKSLTPSQLAASEFRAVTRRSAELASALLNSLFAFIHGILASLTLQSSGGIHAAKITHHEIERRMDWQPVIRTIEPFIVKIETQDGHGTGFICFKNDWAYGIATAAHVVDTAEKWHQAVRVRHYLSQSVGFFSDAERVIFVDKSQDSAMLLVPHADLVVPHEFVKLLPTDSPIAIGNEVGWLGFPGIAADTLCFFSGSISARLEHRNAYLIDGVAINGVSGGPVIYAEPAHGPQIVGVVSAYHANRQRGDTLPGLLIAQDVSKFHTMINHVKSIDEAQKEKQRLEKEPKGEQSGQLEPPSGSVLDS